MLLGLRQAQRTNDATIRIRLYIVDDVPAASRSKVITAPIPSGLKAVRETGTRRAPTDWPDAVATRWPASQWTSSTYPGAIW